MRRTPVSLSRLLWNIFICVTAAFYPLIQRTAFAASAAISGSVIALYQGADREKILIEGAKREGQFTLYTSHTWFRTFVKDFERKYPFIKVSEWRNDSKNIIRKVLEEAKSGRVLVDVVESTADGVGILKREGLLHEYYSPQARYYRMNSNRKGKAASSIFPTGRLTTAWGLTPNSFHRRLRREISKNCWIPNGRPRWRSLAQPPECVGSAMCWMRWAGSIWKR